MTLQKLLISTAIAMGVAGLSGSAIAGSLDGKSIRQLFPGQFEAKVQGYRVQFAGTRDGGLSGQALGQQDTGRWYVKGNTLCVAWKQWNKGKARCGVISQQGGWYVASAGNDELLKFRRAVVAAN